MIERIRVRMSVIEMMVCCAGHPSDPNAWYMKIQAPSEPRYIVAATPTMPLLHEPQKCS
jgi:hypothetical protein